MSEYKVLSTFHHADSGHQACAKQPNLATFPVHAPIWIPFTSINFNINLILLTSNQPLVQDNICEDP